MGKRKSKAEQIEDRAYQIAQWIIQNNGTVRAAANKFKVSRTLVHKDMVERLPGINDKMAEAVWLILQYNKEQRSFRGGMATHNMWEKKKGGKTNANPDNGAPAGGRDTISETA